MTDLTLYDIDNKEFFFTKVSYDINKNRKRFSYLTDSFLLINNKSYLSLITTQGSSYIFYQDIWFRYNNLYNISLKSDLQLWNTPNIGRRLATLNKFFDEGELA
jgi:hypothetical protein